MKPWIVVTLLCVIPIVCCCVPTDKAVAAENPPQAAWGDSMPAGSVTPATIVRVPADAKELTPCKLRKGLSRREKREVGATFRNVVRVLGELQAADPVGFEQSSADELAIDVASVLKAENPQAFQTIMADRDWQEFFDKLLAFLEKLIPFIIQIIISIS